MYSPAEVIQMYVLISHLLADKEHSESFIF